MSGDDPTKFRFGDLIENGWASDANPTKRGIFVRYYVKQGRMNAGPTVVLTDGKSEFWEQSGRADHKLTRIAEAQDHATLVAERDALRKALEHILARETERGKPNWTGRIALAALSHQQREEG